MRKLAIALVLTIAATASASVQFLSPLEGAQVIGPFAIEIRTEATAVDRVEFRVDGVLVGVVRQAPYRIAYDFGTNLASRTIAARVFSNGYRNVENATIHTAALTAGESITVDLVEVPLRIRSARAVKVEDLRVRENSIEQTVREVKPGRGPAHFAFVVDRSLSMGGGRLEAALAAVDGAMRLLRAGDTASLTLFNHNVSKPQPVGAVRNVVPSGGTALRDALASVATAQRTYTIVITDGGDRNSALSEEQALRRISGTKSMITAVVLGQPSSFLQRAAKNTGGSLVRTNDVRSAVRDAVLDINSRYTLAYQSHGTRNGWRTIDVSPRRSDVTISASRKGYFAE